MKRIEIASIILIVFMYLIAFLYRLLITSDIPITFSKSEAMIAYSLLIVAGIAAFVIVKRVKGKIALAICILQICVTIFSSLMVLNEHQAQYFKDTYVQLSIFYIAIPFINSMCALWIIKEG